MREFRTWCKNKEQWETDLIAILPSGALLHGDVTINGSSKWKPCNHKTHIVEFYTGLIDKNGKKIFEGDILTIKNSPDVIQNMELVGEVVMSIFGAYGVAVKKVIQWERYNAEPPNQDKPLYFLNLIGGREFEVTGTIHE